MLKNLNNEIQPHLSQNVKTAVGIVQVNQNSNWSKLRPVRSLDGYPVFMHAPNFDFTYVIATGGLFTIA